MAGQEPEPREGAWVFLSHSHLDLEKVRRIRNELEAKGHNPLMFFLKCLDDDSELDGLIRREIEARTWFILCQSQNARASRWVQEEVAIIKSLEGKVYEEIDLDADLDTQVERVTALSKRATVFISYARRDAEVARALQDALRGHEFRVFVDVVDIRPGGSWRDQITRAIDQALQEGFVVLLLSPEALDSEFVRHEIGYALEGALERAKSGRPFNIVPIIVREREATLDALSGPTRTDDHRVFEDLGWELEYNPHVRRDWIFDRSDWFFDLTTGDLDERITELIKSLKTREME